METRIERPETNIPITKQDILQVLEAALTRHVMECHFVDDDGVGHINPRKLVLRVEAGAAAIEFINRYYPE